MKLPVSSFHLLFSRLFKELFALVVHVFKQVVHQGRNLIFKYKRDNQNNDEDQDHLKRSDPFLILPKSFHPVLRHV